MCFNSPVFSRFLNKTCVHLAVVGFKPAGLVRKNTLRGGGVYLRRPNELQGCAKALAVSNEIMLSRPLIKHLEKSVSLRESQCANEAEGVMMSAISITQP